MCLDVFCYDLELFLPFIPISQILGEHPSYHICDLSSSDLDHLRHEEGVSWHRPLL
jgi:hypothetical protein